MQKPTSAADPRSAMALNLVIVTMDTHLASSVERARLRLSRELPQLTISLHAASEYATNAAALARCRSDLASADIVIAGMLFLEDHFLPVLDVLQARRNTERFAQDLGVATITVETLYDAKAHFSR